MNRYYVNINAQENGDHEVHIETCKFMPVIIHAKYLGSFSTCQEAVEEAKKTYTQSDGCKVCIEECHSS